VFATRVRSPASHTLIDVEDEKSIVIIRKPFNMQPDKM
jgi:hypothetical protein